MTSWSYNALVSAVVNTAEMEGDSTFTTELPNIVDRSERRLTRDLDSFGLVANMSATGSVGTPWIPKPAGCLIVKSLAIKDGGYQTNLTMKTNEWLMEYWPDRTSVGTPKYWANVDTSTLMVAPAFASTNEMQMQFVVQPSAVSVSSQVNYFTVFCPNAFFYSAMVETCLYKVDAQGMQMWELKYQEEIAKLRNEARRTRRDDNRKTGSNWGENTFDVNGT